MSGPLMFGCIVLLVTTVHTTKVEGENVPSKIESALTKLLERQEHLERVVTNVLDRQEDFERVVTNVLDRQHQFEQRTFLLEQKQAEVSAVSGISFSYFASGPEVNGNGVRLQFETELSNVGGHYDPATSSFICPYHAVYFFSIGITNRYEYFTYASLMKNDEVVASLNNDQAGNMTGGQVVVIECNIGDEVWVRSDGDSYVTTGTKSTFSGVLIHVL